MIRPFQRMERRRLFLLSVSFFLLLGCSSESSRKSDSNPKTDFVLAEKTVSPPAVEQHSVPSGTLPQMAMIDRENGFIFQRFDDISRKRRIVETNGGGVAIIDYDGDGWLDLFLTNGCTLPCDAKDRRNPSHLFRNVGEMQFRQETTSAGLVEFKFSTGCAVGDYNNDGFDDLYVTALGDNTFWQNNGDGTFTDITGFTGTLVPEWSTSAAFADLNHDQILDLYVVNYLKNSPELLRPCPNPNSPDGYHGCSPALFEGSTNALFLGDREGGFTEMTVPSNVGNYKGKGLGVVIADLDANGSQEIYVANDGEPNFLFVLKSSPSGEEPGESADPDLLTELSYEEIALQQGVALNERGYAQASMGIAVGDYDSNGTLDLFLTHFYGDTNTLYANQGDLRFAEHTRGSGLGATSRQTLGFGTVFFDFDNDSLLDLFVANGHVDDRTWMAPSQVYRMPPQIYRNEGDGSFTEVSHEAGEYFNQSWLGRGVARGDLNRDGREDLVVSHQLDRSVILQNKTPVAHEALTLRLIGSISPRNGYGTKVTVVAEERTIFRELVGGGSFQSAGALEIHAGLGTAKSASVHIAWPSGREDRYKEISAGRWVAIEGQGIQKLPD